MRVCGGFCISQGVRLDKRGIRVGLPWRPEVLGCTPGGSTPIMIRLVYARFGIPEAGVVDTAMSPRVSHFPDRAVLLRRIALARTALRCCNLCEWRCGVDRAAGEPARCRLGTETHVFKQY